MIRDAIFVLKGQVNEYERNECETERKTPKIHAQRAKRKSVNNRVPPNAKTKLKTSHHSGQHRPRVAAILQSIHNELNGRACLGPN